VKIKIAPASMLLGAVIALLLLFVWNKYQEGCQPIVSLEPNGKMVLYHGNFFWRKKHQVERLYGRWCGDGNELLLPIEGPYNDYGWKVRIEVNGRVYKINKEKAARDELRVINGEWSADPHETGAEWYPVFGDD
jgi:hypothetical protein